VTAAGVFSICNAMAAGSWVLLVVAPTSPRVVNATTIAMPVVFAMLYCGIVGLAWPGAHGGFGSLAAVGELLKSPWLRLAGWIHYLALDLFTGGWIVRDAAVRAMPRLLTAPCLFLVFAFGPAGLLLFLLVRVRWQAPVAAASR
jgi:hypothetical protein